MKWYWKVYRTNGRFEESLEEIGCTNWAPSYLDFLVEENYTLIYVTFSDEKNHLGQWEMHLPQEYEIPSIKENFIYKGDVGLIAQRREKLKRIYEKNN